MASLLPLSPVHPAVGNDDRVPDRSCGEVRQRGTGDGHLQSRVKLTSRSLASHPPTTHPTTLKKKLGDDLYLYLVSPGLPSIIKLLWCTLIQELITTLANVCVHLWLHSRCWCRCLNTLINIAGSSTDTGKHEGRDEAAPPTHGLYSKCRGLCELCQTVEAELKT